MIISFILITLGLAIFFSLMGIAIVIPIYPNIIRITESFVCPPGMKMKVEKVKLSYHRPSEKGIIVSCHGHGETRYVKAKALLYLWLIFFVFSLPVAARIGMLIVNNE
ncbi:MAG: hypothetical protein ISS16_11205 [Ignavibacteria bacterium]|nr:hypothetical protein [Ignavibacteria bacterium]